MTSSVESEGGRMMYSVKSGGTVMICDDVLGGVRM